MTTRSDVREAAAKAAREWAEGHSSTAAKDYSGVAAFEAGFLFGYEAAKAEASPCDACLHNPEDCADCTRKVPR